MSLPYQVLPAARDDINGVISFTIAEFGVGQAYRYVELIELAIVDVTNDPTSIRARHRVDVHPDARTIHISRRGRRASHLILYRIRTDGAIEIARLLHNSMQLHGYLPEDFGTDVDPAT